MDSGISCTACDSDCLQCMEGNQCVVCADTKAVAVGGVCQCVDGYKISGGVCVLCDYTCEICTIESKCTACVDENAVVAASGDYCLCPEGFYNDTVCTACDETCMNCSKTLCLQCYDPAAQVAGSACVCPGASYFLAGGCVSCAEGCFGCTSSGCYNCTAYSSVVQGNCTCGVDRVMTNGACVCIDGYVDTGTCVPCKNYITTENVSMFYSENYMSIYARFSLEMKVGSTSCKESIDPDYYSSLGNNPNCYWLNSTYYLITLGISPTFNSTILPLLTGYFQSTGGACTPVPQTICPIIQSKYPPPHPYLTIIGPDKASVSCSGILTYYSQSSGGAGNPVSLKWTQPEGLSTLVSNNSISYSVSSMPSGSSLSVALTGSNYLLQNATLLYETKLVSGPYLTLVLNTGRNITMHSDDSLKVQANVVDNCGYPDSDSDLWIWTYLGSSDGRVINQDDVLSQASNNTLEILPRTLTGDCTYSFQVSASRAGVQGMAYLDLTVLNSSIVLVLSRSSGSLSRAYDCTISAQHSYDPSGNVLEWHWNIDGYAGTINNTAPQIVLESLYLVQSSADIYIGLTASTAYASASTSIFLSLTSATVQVSNIVSNTRVNLPVLYEVNITAPSGSILAWTSAGAGMVLSGYPAVLLPASMSENVYTLKISGNSSYSLQVLVTPNLPPQCLGVWANSTNGTAVTDVFKALVSDCYDLDEQDYPLQTSFGINTSEYTYMLTRKLYQFDYDLHLFPGEISIHARVCDSLNACVDYFSSSINVSESTGTNFTAAYYQISSEMERGPEAITIVCNSQGGSSLAGIMWTSITSQPVESMEDAYIVISSIHALLPYIQPSMSTVVEYVLGLDLRPDQYLVELILQFAGKAIGLATGTGVVLDIDQILVRTLEGFTADMIPGSSVTIENAQIFGYKSRYISTPIVPCNVENPPIPPNDYIIENFRFIQYKSPANFISVSFAVSGNYKGYYLDMEQEVMDSLNGLRMTIQVNIDAALHLECFYVNKSGNFSSDGCVVQLHNGTEVVLEITHTSLFLISQLTAINEAQANSGCNKNFIPSYLVSFLIISGIIATAVCYKIDQGEKIVEESNLKYVHEGEILHVELSEDKVQPLPSKTFSGIQNRQKETLAISPRIMEFHMYIGLRYYHPIFLRSLKVFTILFTGICELFFIGFYIASLEDTSVDNVNIGSGGYIKYPGMAIATTLPFQVLLICSFNMKRDKNGYAIAGGFAAAICITSVLVIYIFSYNYEICGEWARLWAFLYLYSVLAEILIIHTLAMLIRYWYYLRTYNKIEQVPVETAQ